LSEVYAADHGEDAYERARPRVLRRDLADYLVTVRDTDPETADEIAPTLRALSVTWCSLWLPHHKPEVLDPLDGRGRCGGGRHGRAAGRLVPVVDHPGDGRADAQCT
jgi:hypothetical protein